MREYENIEKVVWRGLENAGCVHPTMGIPLLKLQAIEDKCLRFNKMHYLVTEDEAIKIEDFILMLKQEGKI